MNGVYYPIVNELYYATATKCITKTCNLTEEHAFLKDLFAQIVAMIKEHNSDPESTYAKAHFKFSATSTKSFYNKNLDAIWSLYKAC